MERGISISVTSAMLNINVRFFFFFFFFSYILLVFRGPRELFVIYQYFASDIVLCFV